MKYSKLIPLMYILISCVAQSFENKKSQLNLTDLWSIDGLRYRHIQYIHHFNLQTEVDWSLGFLVQKQLNENKDISYQQLALSAQGKYLFSNEIHQLTIEGGLFPASVYVGVFPLDSLGLKAAGFSVTELYQFYPRHDFYIRASNYWLSDENIKKQLVAGYQYRCEFLDWCRLGYRIEDSRMMMIKSEYWSPKRNYALGPMLEIGYGFAPGMVIGFSYQSRKLTEDDFSGSANSAALSLTKYQEGQQVWRAAIQEGRSQTDVNQWHGIEIHLDYFID